MYYATPFIEHMNIKCALLELGLLLFLNVYITAQPTVGLVVANGNTSPGYTLMAPVNSTSTYLIDYCGRAVHEWKSSYHPGFRATLQPNGDLVRMQRLNTSPILQGAGGNIERRSWDGDLIWEYTMSDSAIIMHHDFTMLPNGNVLVLVAESYSKEQAWSAGRDTANLTADFWVDAVYELQPQSTNTATVVWKWTLWDHLIQDRTPSVKSYGKVSEHPELVNINFTDPIQGKGFSDFSHCNSIDYNQASDQILLSARNFNEIWVIDHSTTSKEASTGSGGRSKKGGRILYRWGNPRAYGVGTAEDQKLFGQHNAHWIPVGLPYAGQIMIFNNGLNRPVSQHASVEVIKSVERGDGNFQFQNNGIYEPLDASFTYQGKSGHDLQSVFMSSAQFLPSGNLRVTEALRGLVSEVNASNEIVWQYVCPINANGPIEQGQNPSNNTIFTTSWYSEAFEAFTNRDLSKGMPLEVNPVDIGCAVTSVIAEPWDTLENEGFTFAPNPCESGGLLKIPSGVSRIAIVDVWGRMVATISVVSPEQYISLTGYPSGCYLLITDKQQATRVVKH